MNTNTYAPFLENFNVTGEKKIDMGTGSEFPSDNQLIAISETVKFNPNTIVDKLKMAISLIDNTKSALADSNKKNTSESIQKESTNTSTNLKNSSNTTKVFQDKIDSVTAEIPNVKINSELVKKIQDKIHTISDNLLSPLSDKVEGLKEAQLKKKQEIESKIREENFYYNIQVILGLIFLIIIVIVIFYYYKNLPKTNKIPIKYNNLSKL
jgi:hypothetical protein